MFGVLSWSPKHLFFSLSPTWALLHLFYDYKEKEKCGEEKKKPASLCFEWAFILLTAADCLRSSPIITCTTDPDRIISVHCVRRDCTLSVSLVVLFRSPLVFAAMLVNLRVTPCGAHASESAADGQCASWARGWRTTTIQDSRSPALSTPEPRAHGGAPPLHPTQYFLSARVYLWRSPSRIYDWSTKARDSPPYPIFGCLRKRESSPCPTHFHNSS